jgi:hypothetical protein
MMVPAFQRDDRTRAFAASLGKAIVDYVFLKEQVEACEWARYDLQGSKLGRNLLENKSKKRREASDSVVYRQVCLIEVQR